MRRPRAAATVAVGAALLAAGAVALLGFAVGRSLYRRYAKKKA